MLSGGDFYKRWLAKRKAQDWSKIIKCLMSYLFLFLVELTEKKKLIKVGIWLKLLCQELILQSTHAASCFCSRTFDLRTLMSRRRYMVGVLKPRRKIRWFGIQQSGLKGYYKSPIVSGALCRTIEPGPWDDAAGVYPGIPRAACDATCS